MGTTPLSGTSACSLATANANAAAGDLVYFRAGTYTISVGAGTGIIQLSHSGTSAANMITLMAYTGETPTIQSNLSGSNAYNSGPYAFNLCGRSYVSIKGFTFNEDTIFLYGSVMSGSNHDEIAFNTFVATTGTRQHFVGPTTDSDSSSCGGFSTNNWIHDNHFQYSGKGNGGSSYGSGCTDGGADTLRIGQPGGDGVSATDGNVNNTIENNFFEHAEHAQIDTYGQHTVIRNNIFHNEPWSAGCPQTSNLPYTYSSSNPNYSAYNGMYSHRNLQITDDYNRTNVNDLVEGNRIGYTGVNQGNDGTENMDIAATQNIIRYNFFFASIGNGVMFKYDFGSGVGNGGHGGTYNRLYNNTFYKNGWGYPVGLTATVDNGPWPETAITLYYGDSGLGNVVKNNLFNANTSFSAWGADIVSRNCSTGTGHCSPDSGGNEWAAIGTVANNWCNGTQYGGDSGGCSNTSGADPQFNNPDVTNPASKTLPDLSLQATSPARNGAGYLTTAANSGTGSTTLTVADAMYFQDGTWGSDLAKASTGLGGTMQADWIAIGTVSNVVQISSITYGAYNTPAGTITLASPMTWSNGASIWLYKKSDGAVVLSGAAPDYGASEYLGTGSTGTVVPPAGLQAIVLSQ